MIYIFDDRCERLKYNKEKLRLYSDCIEFKTVTLISGKSAEECILDSLDNPECIIFHKSYVFEESNVTFESIRSLFISLEVPFVVFSGGIESVNKGKVESNINAELMYENLPYFLDDYKINRKINIDILLWGERHKLNALLQFQNEFSKEYLINPNLNEFIEGIEKVERRIRGKLSKIDSSIGEALIAEINKDPHITWADLAEAIDNLISENA